MRPLRLLLTLLLLPGAADCQGEYKILRKIAIPGEGSYDYLTADEKARRLYVSHGTRVEVLDLDSGDILGKIPDTPGVHGIALVREFGRGYTTNGLDDSSTIFDLKTLAIIGTVKTGKGPDGIVYDPVSKRIFTFNGKGHDATAIDAATGRVAGTVAVGDIPESGAADGRGRVYVNLERANQVAVIDARTLRVENRWATAPARSL